MNKKVFLMICDGMADEPLDDLGGRTPLEVAKTPFMDALAKNGSVGTALFIPHALPASPEVALFSLLGYDPLQFYTGLAPLEAQGIGIGQAEDEILFRCDFVTVTDDKMIDASAGAISDREAIILLKKLQSELETKRHRFYAQRGYRNFLSIKDARTVEDLDNVECTPPRSAVGELLSQCLPKGNASQELRDLMNVSRTFLENHEVNRVRIDLKENPANQLWLWGQGKKTKLPPLMQQLGLETSVFTDALCMKGLSRAAGCVLQESFSDQGKASLNVVYIQASDPEQPESLKNKIKRLELFDSNYVGPVTKASQRSKEPITIIVTSNVVRSLGKKQNTHGQVPFVMQGPGIAMGNALAFTEKMCAQNGGTPTGKGHHFLKSLLKRQADA